MTTKLKTSEDIKNAFDQLFGQLSEQDKLENEANLLMFRFLSIVETKCVELGWNRKQLAEKVGISASYITQLFRGDKLINLTTLVKMKNALKIDFDIKEKQSYAEELKEKYTTFNDDKGLWVFKPFKAPDYKNEEAIPHFKPDESAA